MSLSAKTIKPTKVKSLGDSDDWRAWFIFQAEQHHLSGENRAVYLLAHTDDGVIWGILKGKTMTLAGDVFPRVAVPLRQNSLQQARLFNTTGELLLWRTATGFEYRVIADGETAVEGSFEETQVLWGDDGQANGSFTLMSEGRQGLHHAPPLPNYQPRQAPLLTVRHYVDYDSEGQAYIALSRLVDLNWSDWRRKNNHDDKTQ